MVRKACLKDMEQVAAIYEAIHDAEERGELSVGWARGVYPVKQTALESLERDDLFVLERDGQIMATAIINQKQMPEYAQCQWSRDVPDKAVMVLHTLAVDPVFRGRGCGREFVDFYEDFARENDCFDLRMDTQEKNTAARKFYGKLGYAEVGIVLCTFNGIPGVRLVCLEKRISPGEERKFCGEP